MVRSRGQHRSVWVSRPPTCSSRRFSPATCAIAEQWRAMRDWTGAPARKWFQTAGERPGEKTGNARGSPRADSTLMEVHSCSRKDSALAKWFRARTEGVKGVSKTKMIVALARKLLISLWRMVTAGEVPEGVRLRPVEAFDASGTHDWQQHGFSPRPRWRGGSLTTIRGGGDPSRNVVEKDRSLGMGPPPREPRYRSAWLLHGQDPRRVHYRIQDRGARFAPARAGLPSVSFSSCSTRHEFKPLPENDTCH